MIPGVPQANAIAKRLLRRQRASRTPRPHPDHQPAACRGRPTPVRAPLQRPPVTPSAQAAPYDHSPSQPMTSRSAVGPPVYGARGQDVRSPREARDGQVLHRQAVVPGRRRRRLKRPDAGCSADPTSDGSADSHRRHDARRHCAGLHRCPADDRLAEHSRGHLAGRRLRRAVRRAPVDFLPAHRLGPGLPAGGAAAAIPAGSAPGTTRCTGGWGGCC
jgi:hypothetical protein